jgi:hypothetical protein
LLGRGLSEAEIIVHLATVRQNRSLPLFASAVQLAGLDAGEVQSQSDSESEQREAELKQIYGDENSANIGFAANSDFAQASQMSAASLSSASEAAALLQADESLQPVAEPAVNQTPIAAVESGGIALPQGVSVAPTAVVEEQVIEEQAIAADQIMQCVCESCGAGFEITLPAGIPQAVVACPSCQVDNMIRA